MNFTLHQGDCLEVMGAMADASVDSIVTDPPYHLTNTGGGPHGKGVGNAYSRARAGAGTTGFMGMTWDGGDVAFRVGTWSEALRVLKPGGHLLAFSGSRTYHRLACAIEDAGFEIRDQIMWVYGSGFPKSHNGPWGGTALKPAHEPIVMARKPLIGTVAANFAEHRTGALNIDACRVVGDDTTPAEEAEAQAHARAFVQGRWPANLIHDGSEQVVAQFPAEAGAAAPVHRRNGDKFRNTFGTFSGNVDEAGSTFQGDTGSAARFFYCAKASRADRNEGLPSGDDPAVSTNATMRDRETADWQARNGNHHPTVKPTDLMRYLCRLVTPAGGLVLDPFMGSGSTGKAAITEGFNFVGIELSSDYLAIARERITHAERVTVQAANEAAAQPDLFKESA